MQPDRIFNARWNTQEEADEFRALTVARPNLLKILAMGIDGAEEHIVPRILSGGFGDTEEEISGKIAGAARVAIANLRRASKADRFDADLCKAWRVGFENTCNDAMRARIAGRKLQDGEALIAAGMAALAEAAEMVGAPAPALPVAPSAPSHALSLGRRPLRPEDFGCLPTQRRR